MGDRPWYQDIEFWEIAAFELDSLHSLEVLEFNQDLLNHVLTSLTWTKTLAVTKLLAPVIPED